MSFRLVYTGDAQQEWGLLATEAQEAALDELESLASRADLPQSLVRAMLRVHVRIGRELHQLSIKVSLNHASQTLTILGFFNSIRDADVE